MGLTSCRLHDYGPVWQSAWWRHIFWPQLVICHHWYICWLPSQNWQQVSHPRPGEFGLFSNTASTWLHRTASDVCTLCYLLHDKNIIVAWTFAIMFVPRTIGMYTYKLYMTVLWTEKFLCDKLAPYYVHVYKQLPWETSHRKPTWFFFTFYHLRFNTTMFLLWPKQDNNVNIKMYLLIKVHLQLIKLQN